MNVRSQIPFSPAQTRSSLRIALSLLFTASLLSSCGDGSGQGGKAGGRSAMKFPVEVQTVAARSVVYHITAVGSVEAFEVVQVTSRVSGVIEKVNFTEGRTVRAGDVLVEIEPERYKLAVQSARATYEKALASKAEAEAGLARRKSVVEKNPGLIPGEEIEAWRTRVNIATADVAQTKAALDQAELNLRDAFVRAPVGGVIQTRTTQTGQYVQPGAVLATLVRRDPLLLRFKVTESDAARIAKGMKVSFKLRDEGVTYSAVITLVSSAADEVTRMVSATAEITDPNKERLRPGSFAEVKVPVGASKDMPVIPQTAIRPSERGFLVFVVEGEIAKERIVTLGLRTEDGSVEVTSGLHPGEQLIVRGAEALRDGIPVRMGDGKNPQD